MRGTRAVIGGVALSLVVVGGSAPGARAGEPTYHEPVLIDLAEAIPTATGFRNVAVGDVDLDGLDDIVVRGDGGALFLFPGTSDATVVGPPVALWPLAWTAVQPTRFRVVDVNGDGRADLVARGDQTRIWRNDGNLEFRPFDLDYSTVSTNGAGVLVDLDDDGDLDLVTPTLSVKPNGGLVVHRFVDGGYRSEGVLAGVAGVEPLVLDANGDGRDDLVTFGSSAAHLYLQAEDGSFADQGAIGQGISANRGVALDVDGDGDLDVVGHRMLLRNTGAGLAFEAQPAGVAGFVATVAVDVDGDTFDDLLDVYYGLSPLLVRNRDGVFDAPVQFVTGLSDLTNSDVDVGDVDDDGRPDVITLDVAHQVLSIVRQSGMPAPRDLSVDPAVITAAGPGRIELSGRGLADGAQLDLGAGIDVAGVTVASDGAASADIVVGAAIGGGLRTARFTNPDGQFVRASVEVRTVDADVRRAKLVNSPAPARDVLVVRGSIARTALSAQPAFAGRPAGLVLTFGDPGAGFAVEIPADDPRWRERRGGRKLVFETEPLAYPRVRLVVDTQRERFALRVAYFDFPTDPADGDPAVLRYQAADDVGQVTRTWVARRKGRLLRTK